MAKAKDAVSLDSRGALPETVYNQIRVAILNGVLAPGQMLRQEEMAARLGVSRGPLREALPRLVAEGLVVLHANRGYSVTSLDLDEIQELFDLRAMIEVKLARAAVARRSADDVAVVQKMNMELGALVKCTTSGDARDRLRWFDLNVEFHDALLAPAGLPQHARLLETIRNRLEPYIRMEVYLTGDLDEAQDEHDALVQAFLRRKADDFATLVHAHVDHARVRLLDGLRESGGNIRQSA